MELRPTHELRAEIRVAGDEHAASLTSLIVAFRDYLGAERPGEARKMMGMRPMRKKQQRHDDDDGRSSSPYNVGPICQGANSSSPTP